MTTEQIQHARDLLGKPDNTVSSIARLLGVSRATIYKYVPELSSPALTAAAAPLELPAAAHASGTTGDPPPTPAPGCSPAYSVNFSCAAIAAPTMPALLSS
ncbi:helix-turn-helix resolvase-like protein [Kribbella sp. VKM Ac-2568]|nr:helix-turn-helix resolvase-like protein [Kribbella sp. VKM Ac-2568]